MNLIKKCGGYDKAKQMYEAQLKAGLAPYGYEEALLQYRRENDIFEAGDIVLAKNHNGLLYEYVGEFSYKKKTKVVKKALIKHYRGSRGNIAKYFAEIKHATLLEIEAGHRL